MHLRRFGAVGHDTPRGPLLAGIGEQAGVVDVGNGLAVTFKIESHNHPSYVEPYQGAATGVGGIVRDILAMGARPIGVMDPLRFGPLDAPDTARAVSYTHLDVYKRQALEEGMAQARAILAERGLLGQDGGAQ